MKKKKKQQPIEKPRRRIPLYDPNVIADYIIIKVNRDDSNGIENLKMQMLLYSTQAFFLSITGIPLMGCRFEALPSHPACIEIYERFDGYDGLHSYLGIDSVITDEAEIMAIPEDIRDFIDDVIGIGDDLSGDEMAYCIKQEKPYREACVKPGVKIISNSSMDKYYFNLALKYFNSLEW